MRLGGGECVCVGMAEVGEGRSCWGETTEGSTVRTDRLGLADGVVCANSFLSEVATAVGSGDDMMPGGCSGGTVVVEAEWLVPVCSKKPKRRERILPAQRCWTSNEGGRELNLIREASPDQRNDQARVGRTADMDCLLCPPQA